MGGWLLVAVALLLAAGAEEGAAVEVKVRQGLLRGETLQAGPGRQVYSFKGIPYARPPVGDLRFKDPEPSENWKGVRENFAPPQCPQILFESFMKGEAEVGGDEDCLYLHVHTPSLCGSDLPVMVFIHGGGFMFGDVETIGGTPLPLLTRDVVLASIQYRLGTLGFLSTEDSVLPGNLGLKDQTLALRWVHDNIHSFGGDPNRVTIFGESAGSGSVHLQMLTPHSEGLFQRVIMQSGNALSPWAIRGDHKRVAATVGRALECEAERQDGSLDSQALLTCVQAAPFDKLVLAATQGGETWNGFPLFMVPRVDGEYLPAHPARLLREGRYHKVDIISGVTQHECGMHAISTVTSPLGDQLLADFPTLGPVTVGMDQEERGLYLARRIYYHYLGGGNITFTENNADQLVQMFSDYMFMLSHDLTSQFHAQDAPYGRNVYMYQLEQGYEGSFSEFYNTTFGSDWVKHGEDLQFLFDGTTFSNPIERPDHLLLREVMLDLWTTFAATGNPTPDLSLGFKWSAASPSNLQYLSLQAAAGMRPDPRAEVREFYSNLPTKQNKMLFPERFSANSAQEGNNKSGFCHA